MSRACPIRVARKTEWLRCALAHHFSRDPGVDNEIVVLATGIDQYLQEVFHHLAYTGDSDQVSALDFRLLCSLLGVSAAEDDDRNDAEDGGVRRAREDRNVRSSALPPALGFREFHSRLCGFFAVRARDAPTSVRLPVTEETEHVEREIRLRWPRVRRRKCVSFDLSRDGVAKRTSRDGTVNVNVSSPESTRGGQKSHQRSWQEKVEIENASLRELVEDLRSALQSSDARCMSLEVALKRERLNTPGETSSQTTERQTCFAGSEPRPRQSKQTRRTKDLLRELELIRASRDGQLEEAMRFSQRLEEELMAAYGEVSRLEETVARLRRESAEIKRRAEEARAALAAGLARVKDIQDRAQQVRPLQEKIQNLELELEAFRSRCTCRTQCENRTGSPVESVEPTVRVIPMGRDEVLLRGEEALQRAVEGRAASDEEEDVRAKGDEQCCLLEVKQLINKLHNCMKGCQKMALCHLVLSQNSTGNYSSQIGCTGVPDTKTKGRRHHMPLDEKKTDEEIVNILHSEGQTVDMERVNLSLLEEKLMDVLSLLLQLRDKRISGRTLGKILLNTLDQSSMKGQESIPVFQVVDGLCQQLVSSELLCVEGEVTTRRGVNLHHRNKNPALISC